LGALLNQSSAGPPRPNFVSTLAATGTTGKLKAEGIQNPELPIQNP
jgi:hypothetical protein